MGALEGARGRALRLSPFGCLNRKTSPYKILMKLTLSETLPVNATRVVFTSEEACPLKAIPKAEFSGKALSTCYRGGEEPVLYVGVGKAKEVQPRLLREAAGVAVRRLLDVGQERVAFEVGEFGEVAQGLVEGALMGAYAFEAFLPKDKCRKHTLKVLTLLAPKSAYRALKAQAQRGEILAEATNMVRELGNLPGNIITPTELARRAQKLAKAEGLRCKVWDEAALKKEKFGGILAVGQGSANAPRFIRLDYACGRKNAPTLAVVGKAITFDTGGISIKPADHMDEMKFDKMGGCAVLGIAQAFARLKLPVNLVGLIASAENMPGCAAYRPGDIVTTWDGQTIEVLNTDAEGRIVLADALGYARKVVKPDFMVDMATLTGACLVAIGVQRAGLFTHDEKAENQLKNLGDEIGERLWPLPMGEEFDELMKSDIASLKNISNGRWGGASTAASFLKNWVGNVPWAHLDIAGTAWKTEKKPHIDKGATGFGVRLVTAFAELYFKKS